MTTRWRQSVTGTECSRLSGWQPERQLALRKPGSGHRGAPPPRPLSQLRPLCPSAWESGFWGGPDLRVERSSMLGPPAVRLRAEDFTWVSGVSSMPAAGVLPPAGASGSITGDKDLGKGRAAGIKTQRACTAGQVGRSRALKRWTFKH